MRLIDGDELYQKVVGYNGGAVDKTVAKRLIDQMPTVDAISRQAAIDALIKWYGCEPSDIGAFENIIEKLPSAQPERKKGEWIHGKELSRVYIGDACVGINYEDFHCSACNVVVEEPCKPTWNYCPNCGADMRGKQDD